MELDDYFWKLGDITYIVCSSVVFAGAIMLFRETAKKSFLLIAISGAVGAFIAFLPWLLGYLPWGYSPDAYWYFEWTVLSVNSVIWAAGMVLLFRDYKMIVEQLGQPAGAANQIQPSRSRTNRTQPEAGSDR